MAREVDELGWIVYSVPYPDAIRDALCGYERMLGVISRANKMGYIYGVDFEIGFEYGCSIDGDTPSNFFVKAGSAAAKDKILKGYMRGLRKLRSPDLTAAISKWWDWTRSKDFPHYGIFKKFGGHTVAHMTYPGMKELESQTA